MPLGICLTTTKIGIIIPYSKFLVKIFVKMNNILDRINQIAETEGISIGALERKIGASKNVLARAIAQKTDIQAKWLPIIAENYPQYSLDWLLTGRGEMLREDVVPVKNYDKIGCPYYNVDFQGGFELLLDSRTINPEYYIDFQPYNKDGAMWCNVSGKSMEPEINSGDIILIKEVYNWQDYIDYDDIYGIVTSNGFRTIKRIRKGKTKEQYTLVPTNPDYEQQEIKKSLIMHIFKVLCTFKRF